MSQQIPSAIAQLVAVEIAEREVRGLQKYGTTLDRSDLNSLTMVRHAYEEALDLAMYLRKLLCQIENLSKSPV